MLITDVKFKDLLELVAVEYANCEPELKCIPVDQEAPEIQSVYILTDEHGKIGYIGQSKFINIRFCQHMSNSKLIKKFRWTHSHFFYPGIKCVGKRLQVEGILMLAACPPGNQALMLRANKQHTWSQIQWRRKR